MLHAAQKLEASGPRLGHPHSSAVRGEVAQGSASSDRAQGSRWRPIYRPIDPSTFVTFAVGPEAKIDSRGCGAALGHAVERFAQLEVE